MYISTFRICVYEMYNICSACLALVVCVCWSGVARSLQPGVGLGLPLMMYNVTDSEDYLLYRLSVLIVWGDTKELCEQAMEDWTAKQVRFKPLALWKYPLIHVKGSEYNIDWGYENDQGKYIDNGVQVV